MAERFQVSAGTVTWSARPDLNPCTRCNGSGSEPRDAGFYEDDEPVKDVIAAYEAGRKGRTGKGALRELWFGVIESRPVYWTESVLVGWWRSRRHRERP